MSERRKLADILRGSDRKSLAETWNQTKAAGDFAPLPPGEYEATIISGELFNAKSGTPGYKLTFEISYGDFKGRKLWHDVWLTPAALPMTKRDLAKIGVTALDQLERPLPQRLRCKVKVALRKNDSSGEYNQVRSFEVVGIEKADPFAPHPNIPEGGGDEGESDGHGDAYEPPADASGTEEPFPFGANAPSRNGKSHSAYDWSERR
jgi:hypothetical protein